MKIFDTKYRILILFFLLPFVVTAQHVGPFVSHWSKTDVMYNLKKMVTNNKKEGVFSKITEVDDTLFYFEKRENDSMLMKMTFNLNRNRCDYQEVVSNCGDCAVIRKYQIFQLYKWYSVSESKYISAFNKRLTMETYQHPDKLYNKLILRTNFMTRKEHRMARRSSKAHIQ